MAVSTASWAVTRSRTVAVGTSRTTAPAGGPRLPTVAPSTSGVLRHGHAVFGDAGSSSNRKRSLAALLAGEGRWSPT